MLPAEEIQHKDLIILLKSGQYAKAHAWLNRMDPVQLTEEEAPLCLTAALHATPHLFRKVLSRCPQGEYSGKANLQLREDVRATVSGTLLTLAAALNKPEHVKALLEEGYDPNSAGVASAAAFDDMTFHISNGLAPYGDRCAVGGSRIHFAGKCGWMLQNATPLAAAVACGSREAAAVLLRCHSVWKAESGVVCRAAVSALQMFQGDPRQDVAGMVFRKPRGTSFDPHALVRSCDLQIEYAADFCTYDLLETQIHHNFLDADGARKVLKTFEEAVLYGRSSVRARMRKMTLLAKAFPDVCREPWATGLFLRELARRYAKGQPRGKLPEQWKALCGEEGDLTWASLEMYRMPRANLQAMLKELGKDTRLVMDADSLGAYGREAKWELMDILSHVELRHNTGLDGISALAENLLAIGDLRYLRKAAKSGAFAEENPKALLDYLERIERNDLRALMLAYGGQGAKGLTPRWKQEHRGRQWSRCWNIDRKPYENWLAELTQEDLPEEECLRRLQGMRYGLPMDTFWRLDCTIPVKLPDGARRREVMASKPEVAVICGSQTKPLELMLQYMPEAANQRFHVEFCERSLLDLEGTPLTVAAATGRTEQVRLLLDSGLDPDETGRGLVSSLRWCGSGVIPVTPVMAAIYYGEEESAKLLLEAGAACDFSRPLFRKLLERGDEQTLKLAEKLPDVGFESIPQEWLEHLKEKSLF